MGMRCGGTWIILQSALCLPCATVPNVFPWLPSITDMGDAGSLPPLHLPPFYSPHSLPSPKPYTISCSTTPAVRRGLWRDVHAYELLSGRCLRPLPISSHPPTCRWQSSVSCRAAGHSCPGAGQQEHCLVQEQRGQCCFLTQIGVAAALTWPPAAPGSVRQLPGLLEHSLQWALPSLWGALWGDQSLAPLLLPSCPRVLVLPSQQLLRWVWLWCTAPLCFSSQCQCWGLHLNWNLSCFLSQMVWTDYSTSVTETMYVLQDYYSPFLSVIKLIC